MDNSQDTKTDNDTTSSGTTNSGVKVYERPAKTSVVLRSWPILLLVVLVSIVVLSLLLLIFIP